MVGLAIEAQAKSAAADASCVRASSVAHALQSAISIGCPPLAIPLFRVYLLLHARMAARAIAATAALFIITQGLRRRSAGRPISRQLPWIILTDSEAIVGRMIPLCPSKGRCRGLLPGPGLS